MVINYYHDHISFLFWKGGSWCRNLDQQCLEMKWQLYHLDLERCDEFWVSWRRHKQYWFVCPESHHNRENRHPFFLSLSPFLHRYFLSRLMRRRRLLTLWTTVCRKSAQILRLAVQPDWRTRWCRWQKTREKACCLMLQTLEAAFHWRLSHM